MMASSSDDVPQKEWSTQSRASINALQEDVDANHATNEKIVDIARPSLIPLSPEDYRDLIHVSSARMACFDFTQPISLNLTSTQFVEAVYATPSRCVECSAPFVTSNGALTVVDIVGRPLSDVLSRALGYETLFERWHRLKGSGESFEVEVLERSGALVVLQSVLYAKEGSESFSRLWCILRDVTVHSRAVMALANAERHYRSLVERPGLFLLRIRLDESYEYVSPALEEIIGQTIGALRKDPLLFQHHVHPDDLPHYDTILRARTIRSVTPIETQIRLRMKDETYHAFFVRQSAMTTSRALVTENVTTPSDVQFFDLVAIDIQNHKELEGEIERGARVALVGQLASGIAHDFNNHLMAILGQLNLGLELLEPKHPAHHAFDSAKSAVSACSHMTKQLINVGRGSSPAVREITLNNIVLDAVALVVNLVPASIELSVLTNREPLVALGDEVQLQQVVINLILNARDAMSSQGSIAVSVSESTQSDKGAATDSMQRYARIAVKDSGPGMAPELVEKLFKPFFTTKGSRGGSGLGLSMVKMIVEAHNGRVEVESTPGAGSIFSVFIPLQQGLPIQSQIASINMNSPHAATPHSNGAVSLNTAPLIATRSVMIAEDDEIIRNMLQSALVSLGCSVRAFANGTLLLEHLARSENSCDVIIVDDSMPRIRGLDMLEQLRARFPDVHLILTSGDPTVAREPEIMRYGVTFLAKPYPLAELVSAVC
jgi:signal transduction histidine kinase